MMRSLNYFPILTVCFAVGSLFAQSPSGAARDDSDPYYSYALTVQGSATLFSSGSEARSDLTANLPLLVGDRVWVSPSGRADLLLSDTNRVSVDRDTEVRFQALAFSPDGTDEATGLALETGRIAVEVVWLAEGQPMWIDTRNTRVYLHRPGTYVITSDGDRTEVIVRTGFVEVVDQRGSSVLRNGERLRVEGFEEPISVAETAPPPDAFEGWAREQGAVLASGDAADLEEPLRVAGNLDRYGSWVQVDGQRAWRPTSVASAWQPYYHGYWRPTPSGLYWVSSDPWSSVTWHYGTWNRHASYGWLWYPAPVFAPAHVYWYWGSTYSGWIPTGYYQHYYRGPSWGWGGGFGFSYGFNWGVYGWAGGSWGSYNNWVFCPVRYVGYPHQYRYHDYGYRMRGRVAKSPRGIITTDTRGLDSNRLRRPQQIQETLTENYRRDHGAASREMPDVTPFVERADRLPPEVSRQMIASQPVERPSAAARNAPRTALSPPRSLERTVGQPAARSPATSDAAARTLSPTARPSRSFVANGEGRSRARAVESPRVRETPLEPQGALQSLPGRTPTRSAGSRDPGSTLRTPAQRSPTRVPVSPSEELRPSAQRPSTRPGSIQRPSSPRPPSTRSTPPSASRPPSRVSPPPSRSSSSTRPSTPPSATAPERRPSSPSSSPSTLRPPTGGARVARPPSRSGAAPGSSSRVGIPTQRTPSRAATPSARSSSTRPPTSRAARSPEADRSSRPSSRSGSTRAPASRSTGRSRARTGPPPS